MFQFSLVLVFPVNTTATKNTRFSKFLIIWDDFSRTQDDFPKKFGDFSKISEQFSNITKDLGNFSYPFICIYKTTNQQPGHFVGVVLSFE